MFREVIVVVDVQFMGSSVKRVDPVLFVGPPLAQWCIKRDVFCSFTWNILGRKSSAEAPSEYLPVLVGRALDVWPFKGGFRSPCAP